MWILILFKTLFDFDNEQTDLDTRTCMSVICSVRNTLTHLACENSSLNFNATNQTFLGPVLLLAYFYIIGSSQI